MKSKKIRVSLRTKFALSFAAVLLITIGGIAIANRILLERMYESDMRKSLIRAYNTVNALSSAENELELDKISSVDRITVFICNENGEEVFSSARNAQKMLPIFHDRPEFGGPERRGEQSQTAPSQTAPSQPEPSQPEQPQPEQPQTDQPQPEQPEQPGYPDGDGRHGWEGRFSFAQQAKDALGDEKYIIRLQNDERLGNSFMNLTARLDNGNYLYLQSPMAPVGEAADTANELLLIIGIVALLVGAVIMFAAVGAAVRPIRRLTEIAGAVSALDFSRKYEGKSNDEVGDLGRSINIMSDRLEESINELRDKNARLEKDIELKNSIDRMRKEFIANASHELKTPIALIAGYAEGLKENIAAGPEDRDFYCGVIIDETAKMDKVIKQILTIAELENAGEKLEKTEFSLTELVESAVHSFDILARKKGASIASVCEGDISVTGDPLALEQAVNNYITNAIHHVDRNGEIRVTLSRQGEGVRFGVYNSGESIPDSGAELIWESFGKLDKARTRAYGGSGLGLAIVKRCVELHGGHVGFENKDGGVEFYFVI